MTYSYVVGFGLQALYFVLLARSLGSSDYGVFVGALSFVTVFATVSGLGAGNVLVMRTARNNASYKDQLGTVLVYVAATFVPLAILSFFGAQWLAPSIVPALLPLMISELLFTRVYDAGLQSFQSHDKLHAVAHLNVGAAGIRVLAVLLFSTIGVTGALNWAWVYALVTVTTTVIAFTLAARRFGGPRFDRDSLSSTWRHGVFFAMGMSSHILLNDSDKFALAGNHREAEGGQYGASSRIVNMAFAPLQAITYSLNTTLFRAGIDGYSAVWKVLRGVLPLAFGYVVLAGVALWLLAPVAVIILGSGYAQVAQMLPLLVLTLVGQTGAYLFGDALMGLGKQGVRALCQVSVGLAVLVLNVLLAPKYGWIASAWIAIGASTTLAALLVITFAIGLAGEKHRVREELVDAPAEA